jgi:2-succinyl-6-hydroxy-2,4-cyclohexadiene-1-carboxylate synthase
MVGHGVDWRSRAVDSFESEVSRLAEVASDHSRPRLLGGYSMGARVALGLLAEHPGLFDAAVLIGVHPGLEDEKARLARRRLDAERVKLLRDEGLDAFVRAWESLPLFASQQSLASKTLSDQRDIRLDHEAEGLARALEVLGLAEMPSFGPSIRRSQTPITLVAGSRDPKFCKLAHELASGHSHLRAEIVDGVGHNVLLEAPNVVGALMQRAEQQVVG